MRLKRRNGICGEITDRMREHRVKEVGVDRQSEGGEGAQGDRSSKSEKGAGRSS